MSAKDCEKIIDQAIEKQGADAATQAHARTCPKCAATLALLALLKTSGSPVSDLKPSAAFLGRIESSLATSASEAAATGALKSKLLAAAIGVALAATVAWTVVSQSKKSDMAKTQTQTSQGEMRADPDVRAGENDAAFPQLQLPSATDELK
ncbi:MAG TPA: hypothetical protein DCG57_05160 [Candidatus Riflebacteria bacterium]|jgi:hypothetical protein|nr:hypothetical protein [Candidatus Riflebacteria bacterium]